MKFGRCDYLSERFEYRDSSYSIDACLKNDWLSVADDLKDDGSKKATESVAVNRNSPNTAERMKYRTFRVSGAVSGIYQLVIYKGSLSYSSDAHFEKMIFFVDYKPGIKTAHVVVSQKAQIMYISLEEYKKHSAVLENMTSIVMHRT